MPGDKAEIKEDEIPLVDKEATQFRALTARGIYLAQDRSDIGFAVKELARKMATPTESDWMGLKRLGRYLVGK